MKFQPDTRMSTGLALLVMALVGLGFRSYGIGQIDFWYDEIALWIYSLTGNPSTQEPPLMAWLLYGAMWWAKSANAFLIHLLPIMFGILAIPLAYYFVQKVFKERTAGFLAAALITLSPMAIFYSREGRPYALFMLVSTCLYMAFIHAHEGNSKSSWAVYSLVLFLCCLTHSLTAQIACALGLYSIMVLAIPRLSGQDRYLRIRRFVNFMGFSLVGGGLGSVWILGRHGIASVLQGIYPNGLLEYFRSVIVFVGPDPVAGPPGNFFLHSRGQFYLLTAFIAFIFFLLFCIGLYGLHKRKRNDLALLFFLALAIPLLINFFTLGQKGNLVWARYITHLLMPFIAVASIGLTLVLQRIKHKSIHALLIGLLLTGILTNAVRIPIRNEYSNNKKIALYLKKNAARIKGVLVSGYHPFNRPGDARIANIYFYHKQEDIPVYYFAGGKIKKLRLVPSRGNITMIPQVSQYGEKNLQSGDYAILSRRPLHDDVIEQIPGFLNFDHLKIKPHSRVTAGLTICSFNFSE